MITPAVIELFRDLERGGLAITSTRRLARHVEQRYARWKMEVGAEAWATPHVRAYDDWLLEIWQAAFEHQANAPRLLGEDQELLLWEQVIRRRGAAGSPQALLQLSGTAPAARQTWACIHDWQLGWRGMRGQHGADAEAFVNWAGAVRQALADRNWLTPAELPGYLVDHPGDWLPARGRDAWWMGFDVMSPAASAVLTLLEEHGLAQKRFTGAGIEDPDVRVVECRDAGDEWRYVARWARAELSANPGAELGVICPDLHTRRDEIEEILEDVLHPEMPWRVDAPRVFHLSLGRPLVEYPIAGSALDLLRWTGRRISFETISRTLRSPYLGSGVDLDARVAFELALRARGRESYSIAQLETLAGERPELAELSRLLGAARRLDTPRQSDPGGWSAFFSDWLRAFNWPGERSLDSHEYQAVNAWREQLSRFAGLNTIQERWSLSDALGKLSAMASARILQVHDDQAPLQVMGVAESAGLWFDRIWLAGMSDGVWPPPAQPDPFLPVSLQKRSGMPESAAESVLAHTRARTAGLLAGAPHVTISFSGESGDAPETLSPLFVDHRVADPEYEEAYHGRVDELLRSAPRLERIEDHHAPPPDRVLRGGVALVADQAQCPFRALAHHRLYARDLEEVAPGLDPGARGSIVHDALRRVWDALGDSDALHGLDEAGVDALVESCASGALDGEIADSPFRQRFLELERDRLAGLLQEWLALEKERPWFRVAGTETAMSAELGGARFNVRVDRIDELADGRRLIIDYKTGRLPGIAAWVDPRIEEPQLPIYASSIADDIAALALAGIRRGECELRGVADNVEGLPSLKPVSDLAFTDMSSLRSWWASALGSLVGEYREGVARVDPKRPDTCRYCDAMPLCRVFERGEPAG